MRRTAYELFVASLAILVVQVAWRAAPAWLTYIWAALVLACVTVAYLDRSE
jgi:hypothetical protein